jgi:hypothetical protein
VIYLCIYLHSDLCLRYIYEVFKIAIKLEDDTSVLVSIYIQIYVQDTFTKSLRLQSLPALPRGLGFAGLAGAWRFPPLPPLRALSDPRVVLGCVCFPSWLSSRWGVLRSPIQRHGTSPGAVTWSVGGFSLGRGALGHRRPTPPPGGKVYDGYPYLFNKTLH